MQETSSQPLPTRPPRVTSSRMSSSKESSTGLLMSVIRSLTASRDTNERDREKANLQREYHESDGRLDKLVLTHHSDLTHVMQAFSKISVRLHSSKDRLQGVREKLVTCQKLLHCKRDDLKKLWVESVENKQVLELLDQVESLAKVPTEVRNHINRKHYLHATKLVVDSVSCLESNLQSVEALREVKSELIGKKEEMYEMLVDELHKHIYVKSTADVLKRLKRQGSERRQNKSNPEGTPSRKVSVADILSPALMQNCANLPRRRSPNSNPQIDIVAKNVIEEDINVTDPEEDSRHYISILIECLAILNRIPEAVEAIKERADKEFVNIVKRTGRELLGGTNRGNSFNYVVNLRNNTIPVVLRASLILGDSENKAHLLEDLLDMLFTQFRCVVQMHETVVIVNLRRVENQGNLNGEDMLLYNMADIWSKIQAVLQLVADLYLDISGTASEKGPLNPSAGVQENGIMAHSSTTVSDLNSYFARKRVGLGATVGRGFGNMKKLPLFRFDLSSHAMSLNAYLQEQKEAMKEKAEITGGALDSIDMAETEEYIVCQPAPENLVIMFNPLSKFIAEIDDELNLEVGNHCPLHSYITRSADVFLKQINIDLDRMLEMANKSLDVWKVISDPEVLDSKQFPRPLLQSTLTIERGIQDLKSLMYSLPLYADDFLTYILHILSNYKETCLAAYRGIVQPEPEDKRIISATWAKDEDISRLLKSLPNWATLQRVQKCPNMRSLASVGTSLSFDESSEEVRLRNMRESEILTSNLAQDTLIPSHEILSDVSQLRVLAQLQESMEWLGTRIHQLASSLPRSQNCDSLLSVSSGSYTKVGLELAPLSDVSIATLNQLSRDFEELAETCLLVLHLEVRVHCFYFLLPVATQSSFAMGVDNQEPDPEVVKLNKDLTSIDEALGVALQHWKLRYIFEGVGHLVATILINCASTLKRINQNGVKKMCRNIFAIQQSLTSITMSREVALDYARQYFELFYHTPEEVLAMIVERGPQFQANEYTIAINLLQRSLSGRDNALLESVLKRLTEILNEVAVSV